MLVRLLSRGGIDWKETEKKEAAGDKPKDEAKVEKDAEKKEDKKDRILL